MFIIINYQFCIKLHQTFFKLSVIIIKIYRSKRRRIQAELKSYETHSPLVFHNKSSPFEVFYMPDSSNDSVEVNEHKNNLFLSSSSRAIKDFSSLFEPEEIFDTINNVNEECFNDNLTS